MRGNLVKNIYQILFIGCNFDIFKENVNNKKLLKRYSYFFLSKFITFFLSVIDLFSEKKTSNIIYDL